MAGTGGGGGSSLKAARAFGGFACLPAGLRGCTVCASQAGAARRRRLELRKALGASVLLIIPETVVDPRRGELTQGLGCS